MRTSNVVNTIIAGTKYYTLLTTTFLSLDYSEGELRYKMSESAAEEVLPVVFSNTVQNITGLKTILDTSLQFAKSGVTGNARWAIEEDEQGQLRISRIYNNNKQGYFTIDSNTFNPVDDNANDIGSTNKRFKNLYIAGVITDGTHSLSVQDLANKLSRNQTEYSTAAVYACNASASEDFMIQVSPNAYGQFIVQRDADGMFYVKEPTQDGHPASKHYVDAEVSAAATNTLSFADTISILEGE